MEFPNNAGFSGGVNRGIRSALGQGARYIALFNNDAVADEYWLEELVSVAEADERVGIVAAKILTQDGVRIDSTGELYSVWGWPFPRGRGEVDSGQYDSAERRDVFGASGGASLYRADMLREIGLFNERFFAYFEDVDISFRARLASWSIRYAPEARVRHFIGGTSSRMHSYGTDHEAATRPQPAAERLHALPHRQELQHLYTKNMPGPLCWKYLPRFWASVVMMLLSDLGRGLLAANIRANLTALVYLPAVLADRWKIQSRRKVSVAETGPRLTHDLPPLQRRRLEQLGLPGPTG